MPRRFNAIKVSYWDSAVAEELNPDEILVEFYLMTCPACGPSGIFIASPDTIAYYVGIGRGIGDSMLEGMAYSRIKAALNGLAKKGRLTLHPGDWIWIIGKWKHEQTQAGKVLLMLESELRNVPKTLKQAFCVHYGYTVPDRVSDTVSPGVSSGVGGEREIRKGKKKEKEQINKDISPEVRDFAVAFFENKPKVDIEKQIDCLDKMIRIDGFPQDEVFKVLIWVKSGTDQNAEFWRGVIGSFISLRETRKARRCDKYLNCKASYEKTMNTPGNKRKEMENCELKFTRTGDVKL